MGVWGQDCGWFAVAVSTGALFGVDLKGNESRIGDGCLQQASGVLSETLVVLGRP